MIYEHGVKKERYEIELIVNISQQESELLVKMGRDDWFSQTHPVPQRPNHYQAVEAFLNSQNLAYVLFSYKSDSA